MVNDELLVTLSVTAFLSITSSAFSCFILVHQNGRKLSVQIQFLLQLFISDILSKIGLLVNTFECLKDDQQREFYSQSTLGWVAIISFTHFYVITNPNKSFLVKLSLSQRQLTLMTYLFPLLINLGSLISQIFKDEKDQQYECFVVVQNGGFELFSHLFPTSIILLITVLFYVYSYRWVLQFKGAFSEIYHKQLLTEFKVTPIIIVLTFGSIMLVELVGFITKKDSVTILYQILLNNLNLFGIFCAYQFGINPTIQKLVKWKFSLFAELESNALRASSDQKYTTSQMFNKNSYCDFSRQVTVQTQTSEAIINNEIDV